jgi:hypothetical protein
MNELYRTAAIAPISNVREDIAPTGKNTKPSVETDPKTV